MEGCSGPHHLGQCILAAPIYPPFLPAVLSGVEGGVSSLGHLLWLSAHCVWLSVSFSFLILVLHFRASSVQQDL